MLFPSSVMGLVKNSLFLLDSSSLWIIWNRGKKIWVHPSGHCTNEIHLSCSNAASTTTPAGLMLSAMIAPHGTEPNANSNPSNTGMGDIKQEPALRMMDSPLRDITDP